jgi:hypothetical protein
MESCKGKFTAIGEESKTFLKRLITIEETWIHYCDELERKESSKRWKHVNFSLPKKTVLTQPKDHCLSLSIFQRYKNDFFF